MTFHCTSVRCSCGAEQRRRERERKARLRQREREREVRRNAKARLRSPKAKRVIPMPHCVAVEIRSGRRCGVELRRKRERESGLCADHCRGFLLFHGSFSTQREIDFLAWSDWKNTFELAQLRAAEEARRANAVLS
jgi:hypothetical protein